MKIAVMSDLHLEYDAKYADHEFGKQHRNTLDFYLHPPQPRADLIVLAGDIHRGSLGIDWVVRHFSTPAVVIAGNHEAYGHELFRTIAINRKRASATEGRVVFLEGNTWVHTTASGERIRLVGATLWTDSNFTAVPRNRCGLRSRSSKTFE